MSICGELAGDPLAAILLVAMGYGVLSMDATSLLKVKKVLRNISLTEAQEVLAEVMLMENAPEVQERMERVLVERNLQKFIPGRID